MSSIDKKVVEHVAHLARLSLSNEELADYSRQLADILAYISRLNEVNTEGVPPTSHPLSTLKNVFRKDLLKPSLESFEALRNAPSTEGEFFKVPQVIESPGKGPGSGS